MKNEEFEAIKLESKRIHAEFMDKYGLQIDKVWADNNLKTERAFSKIRYIVSIFKGLKIIDSDEVTKTNCPYEKIRLTKSNNGNYIDVFTNGSTITIMGFNYAIDVGDSVTFRLRFNDVNSSDFNWTNFARSLLDQIHNVIYERKQACEGGINNLLLEDRNDVIIKKIKKNK